MAASIWIPPATLPLSRAVSSSSSSSSSSLLNPSKIPPHFKSSPNLVAAPRPLKLLCARSSKDVRFRPGQPDPVYKNRLIGMLVNRVMKGGKKSLAYHIIYLALKRIRSNSTSPPSNPLVVLRDAIREVTPDVTVKARRVGGSTHQVPVEVGSGQGKAIAIRWLIRASRKRHGKSMVSKLSEEVMDAARGSGEAVRMKEAAHKMAEANRAFAHFR